MKPFLHGLIVAVCLATSLPAIASPPTFEKRVQVPGPNGVSHKLARVGYEVVVNASAEEAWSALADFGNVQDYTASVSSSDWIGDADLGLGAARFCDIVSGDRTFHVKERIFALEDGQSFTYDVYEAEDFPIKWMFNTFGVYVNDAGETVVYNLVDYRLKPGFLTGLTRGRTRDGARQGLLSFKHFLETGDATLGPDALLALYPDA